MPTVMPGARSSVAILTGLSPSTALAYLPINSPAFMLSVAKSAAKAAGIPRTLGDGPRPAAAQARRDDLWTLPQVVVISNSSFPSRPAPLRGSAGEPTPSTTGQLYRPSG